MVKVMAESKWEFEHRIFQHAQLKIQNSKRKVKMNLFSSSWHFGLLPAASKPLFHRNFNLPYKGML